MKGGKPTNFSSKPAYLKTFDELAREQADAAFEREGFPALSDIHTIAKSFVVADLGTNKKALLGGITDKAISEAEGARTLNLRIDSPMLWPIELRPRTSIIE